MAFVQGNCWHLELQSPTTPAEQQRGAVKGQLPEAVPHPSATTAVPPHTDLLLLKTPKTVPGEGSRRFHTETGGSLIVPVFCGSATGLVATPGVAAAESRQRLPRSTNLSTASHLPAIRSAGTASFHSKGTLALQPAALEGIRKIPSQPLTLLLL